MDMSNLLWLFAVAGGPVLLALVIVFGIARRRRLSRHAEQQREQSTRDVYADENRRQPG